MGIWGVESVRPRGIKSPRRVIILCVETVLHLPTAIAIEMPGWLALQEVACVPVRARRAVGGGKLRCVHILVLLRHVVHMRRRALSLDRRRAVDLALRCQQWRDMRSCM